MPELKADKMNKKTVHFVAAIVLTFTFISIAVTAVLNFRPLYVYDIEAMEVAKHSEMSIADVLRQYDALIDYNRIGGEKVLNLPDLPSSENGRIHFKEVKNLFIFFQWGAILGVILSAVIVWRLHGSVKKLYLKYAAMISLLIPFILGIGIALFWDSFFILFHEIMFRNDYWLFNEQTDPIIKLLPDIYFMHCGILIVGCTMLGGALSLFFFRRDSKRNNAKEGESDLQTVAQENEF